MNKARWISFHFNFAIYLNAQKERKPWVISSNEENIISLWIIITSKARIFYYHIFIYTNAFTKFQNDSLNDLVKCFYILYISSISLKQCPHCGLFKGCQRIKTKRKESSTCMFCMYRKTCYRFYILMHFKIDPVNG